MIKKSKKNEWVDWVRVYGDRLKWNDKRVLIFSFICMIPVIGQLTWLLGLIAAIRDKEKEDVK